MKKFLVQLEDRGFSFDVTIEAETMEQAVKTAREKHCAPRQVTVEPRPTWVEPYPDDMEEGGEIYELTHEIEGDCSECGLVFLSRHKPDPSWPWLYTSGDDRSCTTICYGCAQKRKEAGDFCPFFDHYFRDSPACRDCPANDCKQAQTRFFRQQSKLLSAVLENCFRHIEDPSTVRKFIVDNEFGLAYDALREVVDRLPADTTVPSDLEAKKHLALAADLQQKGWNE